MRQGGDFDFRKKLNRIAPINLQRWGKTYSTVNRLRKQILGLPHPSRDVCEKVGTLNFLNPARSPMSNSKNYFKSFKSASNSARLKPCGALFFPSK